MSVRVYRTGAGKVITVCGTFEKGDFARAIGNHSPKYFGVSGIYYAEPIADIIAVFVTSVLFLTITRKFLRNCGNNDMMGKRKQ